jgi:sulfotransferase family protein
VRRKPDTFIIGAPKAGTTSLYGYLREHPQVFMSREKEPGYFAPDMPHPRRGQPYTFPTDEKRYMDLFSRAKTETRIGEASTSYLASLEAARLIHAFQPDARIIVMLRNPVDLIYSLYQHRVVHGSESIDDFGASLELDEDRRSGRRLHLGRAGRGSAYRDHGMLGEQLERWFDEFGAERIHTIVFDDFVADTETEFAKALKFLDVDDTFRLPTFEARNVSHRARKGPVALIFRNPLVRWFSRRALPAVIGERRTAKLSRRLDRQRFSREQITIQPMTAETRAQLEREFEPDVAKLGALLGRNLKEEWYGRGGSGAPA